MDKHNDSQTAINNILIVLPMIFISEIKKRIILAIRRNKRYIIFLIIFGEANIENFVYINKKFLFIMVIFKTSLKL